MKSNKITTRITIIIAVYILVSAIFPIFLIIDKFYFRLINDRWINFLISYICGILGGLATLISIYYTVKSSLEIQRDEYRKRDEEIKSEKNQKDKEARMAFAGEIAIIVSKFLVSETNYYYLKYNRSDAIECINLLEIKLGDINESQLLLLKIKVLTKSLPSLIIIISLSLHLIEYLISLLLKVILSLFLIPLSSNSNISLSVIFLK